MRKFNDSYTGTGPMKKFAEDSNAIFRAMNNPKVVMPPNYKGSAPTISITEDGLVIDFSEVIIYTPDAIDLQIFESSLLRSITSVVISPSNGRLSIDAYI